MADERMTADEARALLAGMTPGTLEVTEMRDGRLADAGEQELAVSIHDDARAFQKPDGTWHSVIVCRGMDGPTREANAAAFASVKRALATVAATAPDDTRAQAAGACDVAAIGARLHAIDREGVRSIDDALVMGAAITDPSTGDVEWILRHAPDVIDCLADAVRRFTAAAAADAFADRVRACHAAAARVERYTLPAEVLALIADVPALLDALAAERERHAAEVAAAVGQWRARAVEALRARATNARRYAAEAHDEERDSAAVLYEDEARETDSCAAIVGNVPVPSGGDALATEVAGARAALQAERDMWQAQIAATTDDATAALDMVDDLVRHALLHHPLPWRIEDDWTREVTAADGTIVAKCMTHERAASIIAAAEKIRAELDAPMCDTCGKPATCGGSYERERAYACDDHCGHGNEDGHCEPVGAAPAQGVG